MEESGARDMVGKHNISGEADRLSDNFAALKVPLPIWGKMN